MKRVFFYACGALSLAGLCSAADNNALTPPSKVVRFADLNLRSPEGIDALYKRITRTADKVCREPIGVRQLMIEADIRACKADSTDRAIAEINLPALSALHASKVPRVNKDVQLANKD